MASWTPGKTRFPRGVLLLVVAVLALALAACEEDDDEDSTQTAEVFFAYVSNPNDFSISGFAIDVATGEGAELAGSPYNGHSQMSMMVAPSPDFVVLANATTAQVIVKRRNTGTGALHSSSGGVFPVGSGAPHFLSVNARSGVIYAANAANPDIWAVTVDEDTGNVSEIGGGPFTNGGSDNMFATALSGDGAWLYSVFGTGATVNVFAVDATDGALTDVAPYSIDPNTLLVTANADGSLAAFTHLTFPPAISTQIGDPDTGDLSAGEYLEPDVDLTEISWVQFHPEENYLYATSDQGIFAYAVDPDTGLMTPVPGSPFAAGDQPRGLAFSPDGKFLLATDSSAALLQVFEVGTNGALSEAPGSPYEAESGARYIAVIPSGN